METLDSDILYKALLSRDKRYDGRFYVGVRTTGIYCRPICPAPHPKRKNINFYRSQTEAELAGFRPCMRCRPDFSPGSSMWEGTAAVVGRALRMIGEGEADEISLDTFAAKLGMTDRHLRRLFTEHLGASPIDIATSKRLHLARQFLSQTNLNITDIAFAAGFKSIRRFNDSFLEKYKRNPRDFRKKLGSEKTPIDGINLEIATLDPYDWENLLGFLRSHCVYGVEYVSQDSYERLIHQTKNPARIIVRRDRKKPQLLVRIENAEIGTLRGIIANIRHTFDVDHNPARVDLEGLRIPGSYAAFETAICIILGQLVSVEHAREKVKKLVEIFGKKIASPYANLSHYFPSPQVLAEANLAPIGSTQTRSAAIRELSRKVLHGEINLGRTSPLAETREKLLQIKGIGPWTSEMISMRCLGDTNAFPKQDLIVRRAVEKYALDAEKWNPWKSYLTLWLWKKYAKTLSKKGEKK